MYCSGCGQALPLGQGYCPQCGRPIPVPVPPVPGIEFQLEGYAGRVKAIAICWFVYAGITLFLGTIGMAFANAFFTHRFGGWNGGPWDHSEWLFPAMMHFAWMILVLRTGLAIAAGIGLLQRTEWGRILAIVSAFLGLIHFPFGTALGIWTLVVLLGYKNTRLYEQISGTI